jgi:type I restriction enzyme S subunit
VSVSEWREAKLCDIGEIVGGGTPSTKEESYYGGDIPWITPKDLSTHNERYIYRGERSITEEGLKNSSAKLMPKGTVLFSSRAPIGYVAIAGKELCTNQGFKSLIPKNGVADSEFIYYLFKHKKSDIEAIASGTTFLEVSGSAMKNISILLPPLPEQKAIAATLSALDDMIELNNQINKTLEEMAQAIFKSWFVDFEPFKDGEFEESELGMIPKGWNVKRIDQIDIEITDYVANGSFAALKENVTLCDEEDYAVFIRNVDLKANSFNKFVDKKSYEFLRKTKLWGGEVIISNVGDVGSVFRCPLLAKPMTLGNNMIMLKSISPVNYNLFLYILFKYSYGIELIKSITSGSAQPKFNKTDFRNLKIIVPPKEVIQLFNNIVEKLYRIVDEGIVENQLLSTVRDTLLPKLMSGEIRVPVEGAM